MKSDDGKNHLPWSDFMVHGVNRPLVWVTLMLLLTLMTIKLLMLHLFLNEYSTSRVSTSFHNANARYW